MILPRRALGALAVVAALLGALWESRALRTDEQRPGHEASAFAASQRAGANPAAIAPVAVAVAMADVHDAPGVPATPASLLGAEADGAVGWNPDGTVRFDSGLRQRFDFLLAGLGELTLAQVRARLERDVAGVAPAERVARVMEAFDRYVAYLGGLRQLGGSGSFGESRLSELRALRVRVLGPEMARAFFEEDEQAAERTIARQALLTRSDLSEDARREALAAVDDRRPLAEREALERGAQLQTTLAETAALEASAASATQRRAVRAARLGATVAQRLADLDDERARWAARVDAFRRARDAVLADDALDDASRRRALSALVDRDFSEPERRRIRALELGADTSTRTR